MEDCFMKETICIIFISLIIIFSTKSMALEPLENKSKIDIDKISAITDLKGKYNESEDVYKISSPRTDIGIKVDGWSMPPFMGLTSWAAFSSGIKNSGMVMGDLVLFQDEVNSAISAAIDNGLQVTALHNHFFYDQPKVFFMHIAGEESIEKLAQGVRAIFDATKNIRLAQKTPKNSFGFNSLPKNNTITPSAIEKILQAKGEAKEGMYKVVIGRKTTMECGCTVGKDMGINSWAAFAGSDDNAIVDGDLAVFENELQPILKSLRTSGINIVAIHNHMTKENPRMLFVHYWGRGSALSLAKAIKEALAMQK